MTRVSGFLALLTSFCWAQQPVEDVSEVATVSVTASTTFGEPVGQVVAILNAIGPKARYRQYGDTISFRQIPFGLYDLEVQAAGFNTRRERVAVYQTEVRLWCGLLVSPLHSEERSEVVGSVALPKNIPADLWVRLVPLYSSDLVESRITPDGTFRVVGLEPGRYALLVFDKSRLIMTKPLDYYGGKLALNVDLSGKPQVETSHSLH